ncbi:MAG: DUF4493 domain-containing protein [Bacteroidaceae bacterium]|nr:DUF4493 domain-containing protein [Bacteroidaceae bacterium]
MKKIFSILSVLAIALTAVSCSSDIDELANEEVGYLKLGIETNGTTMTRASAPTGYDATQLYVEVKNASNEVVFSTNDIDNESQLANGQYLTLTPGQYTVVAHSYNWDGNGSGFKTPYYYGETTVTVKTKTLTTAKVTCTLANVKVTVNFSDEFKESFARATATIESAVEGVSAQAFTMGSDKGSAYFPVGNLTAYLSVFNKSGQGYSHMKEITDVQARDHYIINYTVAAKGYQGGVTVKVDPTTNTYTYTFEVPRKGGTSLAAYTANAWGSFAYLSGAVTSKKGDFDQTKLKMQWKTESATEWTDIANDALTIDGDDVSCKLTGLTPSTNYVYRLAYVTDEDETLSAETAFTTEAQTALYNGGFEDWYSVGNYSSPNADANTKYWDTSNPGSASFNYVVTYPETSFVHGGSTSAKLQAAYAVIKLAAGSIYTGQFGKVSGTSASLNWGVPFTARPTALHGFKSYTPGSINRGDQPSGVGAPASGSNDIGIIRVALLTEQLAVNNKDMSTFPDWQTDSRVVAYGVLEFNTSDNGQWVEFTIPLEYHSLTTKPTHILVMGATCKYGDYFYGSDSSVLYLDDFELVYGDEPAVKQ